ncbi:NAD(P)H-quinone oxidoreductase [Salinibacterium hongtaonis]|uniref:NAD(P)H-quinone oxidoreductase n=1 Tax=Homoserinimonas hongtaonis TaxID=2079791 RepID=UPI000D3425E8|nr:NAD(P)H-quinone oxidoreductase [Salinibacterium hongtaonis]AWB90237.1 NADPH:quinone oxidoreductase [Salinibacterium hongtaonis]
MRAIVISSTEGDGTLAVAGVDEPEMQPGHIRIRVAAAAINRADVAQRQGSYPSPPGSPDWPGLEVSGIVSEIAPDVTGFAVGDRVCALLAGGGYSEEVVAPAALALHVPDSLDLQDAAALPEAIATVWSNVFMSAQLQPGETLLVHGGGSGIGTMAIQLAKLSGARVAVTAGSAEKLALCAELGADVLINYRTEDFVERVKEEWGGADVILDIMGGSYMARNIQALAMDGRIMVIANQSGENADVNPFFLMRKRGRIWGTTLRARPLDQKTAIMDEIRATAWPWVESGQLVPVIDSRFSFDEAAAAHAHLESSAHTGKILLIP